MEKTVICYFIILFANNGKTENTNLYTCFYVQFSVCYNISAKIS